MTTTIVDISSYQLHAQLRFGRSSSRIMFELLAVSFIFGGLSLTDLRRENKLGAAAHHF